MTDTVEATETAVTQTVYEFFYGLATGTHVRGTALDREYLYAGTDYNDDGNQIVVLYYLRYGTRHTLQPEECGRENDWATVKDDDGNAVVWDRRVVRAFGDREYWQDRAEKLEEQRREALNQLRDAQSDFRVINDKLNDFADNGRYGRMCEEYEQQLESWNYHLQTFKLVGRPRDWSVQVRIADTTFYVDINAQSREQAIEIAQNMTIRDIIRKLIDQGIWFDDWTMTVEDAEVN